MSQLRVCGRVAAPIRALDACAGNRWTVDKPVPSKANRAARPQAAAHIGADAIVIGTHGHTTVGEIVLGSTAHRVAQKSPVPVLLVRVAESDTATGL